MTKSIEIDAVIELNRVLEEMIQLGNITEDASPATLQRVERRMLELTQRYAELQPQVEA
jgi:hypothetical protein